jgi:uncharacterized membrane protein
MTSQFVFDFPMGWQVGLPLTSVALASSVWSLWRRGFGRTRIAVLTTLRGGLLLALVFLASRPTWVEREESVNASKEVALLMDRSESMSLVEDHQTRYQRALNLVREQLLPAVKTTGWKVQPVLFAEDTASADGTQITVAKPNGKRTNLARAILHALTGAGRAPVAIIALTDGAANETAENTRALSALVEAGTPFVGIGFGSDTGVQTLGLRQADAPPTVAPNQQFSVAAQLEMVNVQEMPPFDLVLLRDGQFLQKKTISPGKGSRLWLENFRVSEDKQGAHQYSIQLLPPSVPGLTCVDTMATASVRITTEKELRVLFVQGALTWDYKFIALALRGDPSIKLTGLTRTSKHSVFRQNVESAGELLSGFPLSVEEIAPFRIVVLSNLKPPDLTPAQQEVLARFCGELGGGVLMIGGPGTFDASWQGTRLEQLLPVVFANAGGVQGLDRPFHMQLTSEAFQNPAFQISDSDSSRKLWARLPTFTQYGRVDAAKAGAQVWALHEQDVGPNGPRILMAAQRYGAGQSAVLCVQNFWRWRLDKDSDPQVFDRFWRQLFRWLGESSRQDVAIQFADQELRPQSDISMILERQPDPKNPKIAAQKFRVRVEAENKEAVLEQTAELAPSRPFNMTFHAGVPGIYTVIVLDSSSAPVAMRSVQIRDISVEFRDTARNMELLRQWANLSGGLALRAEDCRGMNELLVQLKAKVEQSRRGKVTRQPLGVNGWVLAGLLGCLSAEYVLRKRWMMR